jgi:hypothetical protein
MQLGSSKNYKNLKEYHFPVYSIVRGWGYHPTSNWYWAMFQNAKKGPGRGGSPGVNVNLGVQLRVKSHKLGYNPYNIL